MYLQRVVQLVDSKRIRIIKMEEPQFIVDIDATSSMPKKEIYSKLATEKYLVMIENKKSICYI